MDKEKIMDAFDIIGFIWLLASSWFIILGISLLVGSGMSAVRMFTDTKNEVLGYFSSEEDLLKEIWNNETMGEEDYEKWMISRDSLVYLLEETEAFNNREAREETFSIEGTRTWREYEPSPTPVPTATPTPTPKPKLTGKATGVPVPVSSPSPVLTAAPKVTSVPKVSPTPAPTATPTPTPFVPRIFDYSEKETTDVLICESQTLVERYQVDWQLIYLLCVYRNIDSGEKDEKGVRNISTVEVAQLIELLKPKIVYEFDPIEYWEGKKKLTESDVSSHPHDLIEYDEEVTKELVVGGKIHHTICIPKFRVKEVLLPYGKDVYEYTLVRDSSGKTREVERYYRVYDKERFLSIVGPYLGMRDMDLLLIALETMPGMEGLVVELRNMLVEE